MRRYLLLILLVWIGVVPVQAQWYRRANTVLKAMERVPAYSGRTPGQVLFTQVERTIANERALQAARLRKGKEYLLPELRNSVFTLREKNHVVKWLNNIHTATTFILEETYQGQTYLWGATATHYNFINPVLQHPDYVAPLRVSLQAQGNEGMTDIALFPLPADMKNVTPLKLASQPVKLGEELQSIGFFAGEFHLEGKRQVWEVTPQRILTSLSSERGVNRIGACGGPVLNSQNEVVGVHVGSSSGGGIGFVVPAAHLQRLLTAYHEGAAPQPLLFNGRQIGSIQVNECVLKIGLADASGNISWFSPYHREAYLDYAHLEHCLNFGASNEEIDRLIIIIQRTPFSSKNKDKKTHVYKLTYDLDTHQTTWEQDDSYAEPY